MNTKWTSYYSNTNTKSARPLLVEAMPYVNNGKYALDLGCGAGNDTIFLRENGFTVTSVDSSLEVKKYIPDVIISTFEDFSFSTDKYDIVNAQYSLPFNSPDSFHKVFDKITKSLRLGGIFVGQFFGDSDEWSKNKDMSFYTKDKVLEFFNQYHIHVFREKKENGRLASGEAKFWHVFSIIAEKTN
ncbi:MAG: methyltransferase domain-containing protein [Candidatus Nomurabacteria bacterium]|nr:methyltransferase domain-containing protein [Candidatus Nomurabacteria bacterium]USN87712.1 MAG: methyltransferase domain-containing protein [Candidatus Nomurabacteria bacterium]